MNREIKTAYNKAAEAYRENYASVPPRVDDIDLTLSYINKPDPQIIEIGCAYGREASHLVTKTDRYLGIDISDRYIAMAQAELPAISFMECDVLDFNWPVGVDVVFAFASLLHSSKEELQTLLLRISDALNPGGVVFISLKRRDQYETEVEHDEVTSRRFYYYTQESISIDDITPEELVKVYYDERSRSEEWLNIILQKQPR